MANIHLKPEGDERFIYVGARHWTALVLRETVPVVVGAIAFVLLALRTLSREPDVLGRQPPLFDPLNIALMLVLLAATLAVVYVWFDWSNDHLIVSNKRIVHEDRTLLLAYKYETIPLDQVQNVNIRTDNILQYVLRYGRVEIQAAGPTEPIVFVRANCPGEIQKQILAEVQREKRSQEQRRLQATVERRLDPSLPPMPPLHVEATDQITRLHGPLQLLFPLGPVLQNGVIIWHRHWVILLQYLIGPALAFALWLGALLLLPRFELVDPTTFTVVMFVLLLMVLAYAFWQYDNWRNDIYVLEPSKIIDIQRLPFGLYEDRREATLGVIQNVNATSPNIVARLLGYGDVLIETAGAGGNFTFDHVPNPDEVQRIVFEYRERFRWQQREREWNNTLNIVEMYHRAQNRGNSSTS